MSDEPGRGGTVENDSAAFIIEIAARPLSFAGPFHARTSSPAHFLALLSHGCSQIQPPPTSSSSSHITSPMNFG